MPFVYPADDAAHPLSAAGNCIKTRQELSGPCLVFLFLIRVLFPDDRFVNWAMRIPVAAVPGHVIDKVFLPPEKQLDTPALGQPLTVYPAYTVLPRVKRALYQLLPSARHIPRPLSDKGFAESAVKPYRVKPALWMYVDHRPHKLLPFLLAALGVVDARQPFPAPAKFHFFHAFP